MEMMMMVASVSRSCGGAGRDLVFLKLLGMGGSSHVYLAKQSPTQRTVAVKVIKKHGRRKTRNGVLRERHMQHAILPFDSLASLIISHYHSSALIAKCLFEGRKAENLEYLEFWQGRGCDDDDDFDYGSITTRKTLNIKALTILLSDDSRGALLNLLSTSFHLPRLYTFKLGQTETLDTTTREVTVNKAVAFLDTVDSLKSLSMHGVPMTDADVLRLLNKTPLLEEVSLTFMREGSGPEVLKDLTAPNGASFVKPALPFLRGVNFLLRIWGWPADHRATDMLRSRLPFSAHSDAAGLSEVAALENIFIEFDKGSCSHDAARVIRNAASSAYRLRWLDWKTFSLLKAGCKHRWVDAAGPYHSTLQHRSYFEVQSG
ncbi:hypothetical protein BDZ89DRAFT_1133483 [Hymenopellis radicata]|nr:hypothetical protein BDZ89DRAFT_1133483 [Hymenopellis radicata]